MEGWDAGVLLEFYPEHEKMQSSKPCQGYYVVISSKNIQTVCEHWRVAVVQNKLPLQALTLSQLGFALCPGHAAVAAAAPSAGCSVPGPGAGSRQSCARRAAALQPALQHCRSGLCELPGLHSAGIVAGIPIQTSPGGVCTSPEHECDMHGLGRAAWSSSRVQWSSSRVQCSCSFPKAVWAGAAEPQPLLCHCWHSLQHWNL